MEWRWDWDINGDMTDDRVDYHGSEKLQTENVSCPSAADWNSGRKREPRLCFIESTLLYRVLLRVSQVFRLLFAAVLEGLHRIGTLRSKIVCTSETGYGKEEHLAALEVEIASRQETQFPIQSLLFEIRREIAPLRSYSIGLSQRKNHRLRVVKNRTSSLRIHGNVSEACPTLHHTGVNTMAARQAVFYACCWQGRTRQTTSEVSVRYR